MEKESISYQIRRKYSTLRKSEKKVGDYVLAHEIFCRKISLDELAKRSGVSQPTVMRFVKALGYKGYKEFQFRLLEESSQVTNQEQYVMHGYSMNPNESIRMIPTRVVATSVKTIEDMLKSIEIDAFEKALQLLGEARHIMISCVENSSATAKDLMTKMLYLGLDCRYDEDYYIQQIVAASYDKRDVVIGISYSGQSKDTIAVMKEAKKAGASTICITNFKDSHIHKWSDIVLCSSQEQWMYGDSIFSRTTQMVLNDMIYMGLLTMHYESYTQQLDKNSKVIKHKGY